MKSMMSRRSGSTFLLLTVLAFSPTISEAAPSNSVKIPHSVTGLTIAANDPLVRSITLKWNSNPRADGVDKYAIYLLSATTDHDAPTLVAVTDKNGASLKKWDPGIEVGNQPVGTVFFVPFADITMYVIAHNKYGWGLSWPRTKYPEGAKAPVLSKAQIQIYGAKLAYLSWNCTKEFKAFHKLDSC